MRPARPCAPCSASWISTPCSAAAAGLGKITYPKALVQGLIESFYRSAGKLINVVDEMRVHSISSKAVAVAWGACYGS